MRIVFISFIRDFMTYDYNLKQPLSMCEIIKYWLKIHKL